VIVAISTAAGRAEIERENEAGAKRSDAINSVRSGDSSTR